MYNMKKLILILIISYLSFIISCKPNQTTVYTQIINHDIEVNDVKTINDLQDVLTNSIEESIQYCVGVSSKNSYSIIDSTTTGSGVIIGKDNDAYFILTNYHVITTNTGKIFDTLKIYLGEDIYLDATYVSGNSDKDIAILKVETQLMLKVCKITSSKILVGATCFAVGCPYDMETYFNSVTIGYISGLNRLIEETSNGEVKNKVTNVYLQHCAPINVGSSGGGLFNLNGELIGINDWKVDDSSMNVEGMSFAIPIEVILAEFSSYFTE